MAEKPPAFVVVDRRKFTAEGEIRDGYEPPPPIEETVAAPEPAAVHPFPPQPQVPPTEPKVVTMPTRSTVEADDFGSAEDHREEALQGTFQRGQSAAGLDGDGDGLSSDDEAFDLGDDTFSRGREAFRPGDEDEHEENMVPGPPPSAAESAALLREYKRLSGEMDLLLRQANPGLKPTAPVGFEHIVQNFYLSAIMAMGAGTEPGQKPRIDILGARQAIDMLAVLDAKTRGHLDDKEQRLLEGVTYELRLMFLELTQAIAAQAQQAPPPGRK